MADRPDYVALEWVKSEIQETLTQASKALEAFADAPDDSSHLQLSLTYLHQVHGTLQMVEFTGAALLAKEIELLSQAFLEGDCATNSDNLALLLQAMMRLPQYLDQMKQWQHDLPIVILPLLNDLRAARGQPLLSETALFAPDLSSLSTLDEGLNQSFSGKAQALHLVRKLRQMYQLALLGWLRGDDSAQDLEFLVKAVRRTLKLTEGTALVELWRVADVFVNAIKAGLIVKSPGTIKVTREIDYVFKAMLAEPKLTAQPFPVKPLLKNMLFYIAKLGKTDAEAIAQVHQRFGLGAALLSDEEIAAQRDRLNGPDRDTIRSVVSAFGEELAHLKDSLDVLVHAPVQEATQLMALASPLQQLCDSLAAIGLTNPQQVLAEQIARLANLEPGDQVAPDYLLELADALLYVESALASTVDRDWLAAISPASVSRQQAQQAVLREARNGIEDAKDAIVEYLGSQFDTHRLTDAANLLGALSSSLSMVPMPNVSRVLKALHDYMQTTLIDKKYQPQWPEADALADALVGVDYYLERLAQDGSASGFDILQRSADALAKLGVTVLLSRAAEEDSLSAAPAVPASATKPAPPEHEEQLGELADTLPTAEVVDSDFADTLVIEASAGELIDDAAPESIADIAVNDPMPTSSSADLVADDTDLDPNSLDDDDLIDAEIIAIFIEEVEEVLATINEYLPRYREDEADREALTECRRAFHTLKGSGRMVQATLISEASWAVENMLNRLLDGTIERTSELLQVVAAVAAEIPALVAAFEHRTLADPTHIDRLVALAAALADGESVSLQPDEVPASADSDIGELASAEADSATDQLLQIFNTELASHLEFVEDYLADEPVGLKIPDALQRALHTMTGSAHMAGIGTIAQVTEPVEMLVKDWQEQNKTATSAFVSVLSRMLELVKESAAQRTDSPPPAEIDRFIAEVDSQRYPRGAAVAQEAPAGPSLMSVFLSKSMDIVMDAEHILQQWQASGDAQQASETLDRELGELIHAAQAVDLLPLSQLSNELRSLYVAVQANPYIIGDKFFALAEGGHESLIAMMDRLAAGQSIRADALFSERVQQFYELYSLPYEVIDSDLVSPAEPTSEKPAATVTPIEPVRALVAQDLREADAELIVIFLEEAHDILESLQVSLDQWIGDPNNTLEVEALQRDLHTLKGGARMAEVTALGDFAHELEFLYEGLAQARYPFSPQLAELLQQCQDRLTAMVADIEINRVCTPAPDLLAAIAAYRADPERFIAPERAHNRAQPSAEPEFTPAPAVVSRGEEEDAVAALSAQDLDFDILEIFAEEAEELLNELENTIDAWRQDTSAATFADEIKRILHTLKGGSRLARLQVLSDLSHEFESFIISCQQNKTPLDDSFFGQILQRQDELVKNVAVLQQLLQRQAPEGGGFGPSVIQMLATMEPEDAAEANAKSPKLALVADADASLADQDPADNKVIPFKTVKQDSSPDSPPAAYAEPTRTQPQETVKVSANLLEGLVNLAGETSISRSRLEQEVSDFGFSLADMDQTIDRLRDQVRRLDIETEAQIVFRQERAEETDYEDFDPLEMDRYSQIQQLSRSLLEATSDLNDIKTTLTDKTRDAETILLQQSRINTELQEGLMQTRMVPFSRLLPRLRRIVRQVAGELEKNVELVVANAEGDVDRTVLEKMISPLEHLLRNAVDHGIEAPALREHIGKDSKGLIKLDLNREGSDIVLTLSDDGKGLDVAKIRNKAVERGLLAADAQLNEADIMQFILQPGFSTAEQVTQISGRGVGMDVVNSEVKQLGGSIYIDSQQGRGSTFAIRLPFTVSINRALMVEVADDLYALPLTSLEGIVRITPKQLARYYQPDAPPFEYGGKGYRLEYMGSLLQLAKRPVSDSIDQAVPLVLVRGGDDSGAVALHVDRLLGSREIVVKTLGAQFAQVAGVSGATILGDGSVVVILDLSALIRSELGMQQRPIPELLPVATPESTERAEGPVKIMVCDDSVTVRKVTSRFLSRQGMDVLLAKDGADAMSQLLDVVPDLILLDIEMPRMDGFEVASRVRHDERLKHIPIVMITSRTGAKHRERALSIGVNEYVGKPFQEARLLESIQSLLHESRE